MRKLSSIAAALLLLSSSFADATSTVNPNVPAANSSLSSAPIRSNFAAAYADINALQGMSAGASAPNNPVRYQLWADTTSSPATLKIYDGTTWVSIAKLNSTSHAWTALGTWNGALVGALYGGTGQNFSAATGVLSFSAGTASVGSIPPASIPPSTLSTLGGVFAINGVSHQWLRSLDTSGVFHQTQPAAADLSDGTTGLGGAVVLATAPNIVGGTHTALTSLGLRSTGTGAFDLTLQNTENLTGGRALIFKLNDASRTIDLAYNFSLAGTGPVTFTGAGSTNVTLPTTGTLATLAGTETLTNKSMSGASNTFTALPLTSAVTGILPGANGGTGNGFFAVSGPSTSLKTFAFPDASATVLTTNALVTVAQGGTGLGTLTAHALYAGNGTSAPTALSVGATGTVLGGVTGADPVFTATPSVTSVTTTATAAFGVQLANTGRIEAKDTGGTSRDVLQYFSDNKVYLTGGSSGGVIRAPDSSSIITWTASGSTFATPGYTGYLKGAGAGSVTASATVPASDLSGQVAVANGGTGLATLTAHSVQVGNGSSSPTQIAVGAAGTVFIGNTGADPSFSTAPTATTFNGSTLASATRQVLTSGTSATYTTPAGVRQLRVRMIGGGGGGGGAGSSGPNDGGAGGNTSFNSIVATGGGAGSTSSNTPGTGGSAGTGTASIRARGGAGRKATTYVTSGTNAQQNSGDGGDSAFAAGGPGGTSAAAGTAGATNTGAGGGGGASTVTAAFATIAAYFTGVGGGAGEYVEYIINSPAATYTYTVGTAGTAGSAGTSGTAGGAGGSGIIIVDEIY